MLIKMHFKKHIYIMRASIHFTRSTMLFFIVTYLLCNSLRKVIMDQALTGGISFFNPNSTQSD